MSGGLSGRLRDLAFRASIVWRGEAYWHWRYYGWDYHAEREASGWRVRLPGGERYFADLSGWRPPDETLHIVLSGPSVAAVAGQPGLSAVPTVAVNGSFRALLPHAADLYVVTDIGFLRRQWPTVVEAIKQARCIAIDHRVLLEIARRDPDLLDRTEVRLFDNLTRPYGRSAQWWIDPPAGVTVAGRRTAFSMNAAYGYFPSCTVAYLALQIAATQQPERIRIFGLDLGGSGRFYSEQQPEKSMIVQDLDDIVRDFGLAAEVLQAAGIPVINASPHSALPETVFPRCDPLEALGPPAPPVPQPPTSSR